MAGLDRTVTNSEFEIVVKSTEGNPLRSAREYGKLTDRSVEGIIWCDPDNFPGASSAPIVTVGFKKDGAYSVVLDKECGDPTFETGALAGRLMLNIITGKPVPSREILIKCSSGETI